MGKVGPRLEQRLEGLAASEYSVYVRPTVSAADPAAIPVDSVEVISWLKERAKESQDFLVQGRESTSYRAHWIVNAVVMGLDEHQIRHLAEDPNVEEIELNRDPSLGGDSLAPDGIALEEDAPSPPVELDSGTPWHLDRIGAPTVWEHGLRGNDVVVAVLDTGVVEDHEDLRGQFWQSDQGTIGTDLSRAPGGLLDTDGHGTRSAGTIAGTGAGGIPTGVAPGCKLMIVKLAMGRYSAIWPDLWWEGTEYALDNGAHVITSSLSDKESATDKAWLEYARNSRLAGRFYANSAGNLGDRTQLFPVPTNIGAPANCPAPWHHPSAPIQGQLGNVVTCGASDRNDRIRTSSGRGPTAWPDAYPYASGGLLKPDLCAPGHDLAVLTPWPDDPYRTGFNGGTSSATPHVAGCMALLAEAMLAAGEPIERSTVARAVQVLEETCSAVTLSDGTAQPPGSKLNDVGSGRIDVAEAYREGRQRNYW